MKKTVFLIMLIIYVCVLSFSCAAESETTKATTSAPKQETVAQVQNLKFEKGTLTTVTMSWDKVKDADEYYIYHYFGNNKKPEYIGNTTDTSATVNALESGKTWKFSVRAVKITGEGKIKGKLSKPLVTVSAPKGTVTPKTKSITADSITLYWDKLPGATGYKVYYYSRQEDKYVPFDYTNSTSITVTGLEKNTFYSFKVRAYRRVDGALCYGEYSDIYLESTDSDTTPRTYAQSASAYNKQVNKLKAKKDFTVQYKKIIDTEFLMCDVENLTNSVKNTVNLYDGTLNKKYKFVDGKSGKVTPDSIFEPYGKKAGVERGDIEDFSVKRNDDGYTLKLVLKSEENFFDSNNKSKNEHSYFDRVISLPKYKTLDTTPLKIKKADSYYSEGKLVFKVRNNALSSLKIRCAVMSSIDFYVSTLKANTVVTYSLSEDYTVKENK